MLLYTELLLQLHRQSLHYDLPGIRLDSLLYELRYKNNLALPLLLHLLALHWSAINRT